MSTYYKFYNLSRNKVPFKNIKNVTSTIINLNKHENHYIKPSYSKKTNLIINEGKVLIKQAKLFDKIFLKAKNEQK